MCVCVGSVLVFVYWWCLGISGMYVMCVRACVCIARSACIMCVYVCWGSDCECVYVCRRMSVCVDGGAWVCFGVLIFGVYFRILISRMCFGDIDKWDVFWGIDKWGVFWGIDKWGVFLGY